MCKYAYCHLDHFCQGCQVLPCCHQKILPLLNSSAAVASYSRLRWNKWFFPGTSLHRNELACVHLQHNARKLNFVWIMLNLHLLKCLCKWTSHLIYSNCYFPLEFFERYWFCLRFGGFRKFRKIHGKQKSCKARRIKIISPAFFWTESAGWWMTWWAAEMVQLFR